MLEYIERKIASLENDEQGIANGIKARSKMRATIGEKIRDMRISSKAVAREGRSTKTIASLIKGFQEELKENNNIITALKGYREGVQDELKVYKLAKKALTED